MPAATHTSGERDRHMHEHHEADSQTGFTGLQNSQDVFLAGITSSAARGQAQRSKRRMRSSMGAPVDSRGFNAKGVFHHSLGFQPQDPDGAWLQRQRRVSSQPGVSTPGPQRRVASTPKACFTTAWGFNPRTPTARGQSAESASHGRSVPFGGMPARHETRLQR